MKILEKDIKDIEVSPIVYKSPTEVKMLIPSASQCDVLLFAGELPFYYAKEEIALFAKPTLYIPDNELSVALTLLYVTNHLKIDYDQLSIDLTDRKNLQEVVTQLNINSKPLYIQDFPWLKQESDVIFQIDEVIARHVELWETKQISYVITSIHAVYDKLVALHIPCMRLLEPKKNIIDSLIEARNLGKLNNAKKSQIAVGVFVFHSPTILAIHEQELQEIAKCINFSVKKSSPKHFIIYGTRRGMEYLIENKETLHQFYDRLTITNSTVSIGFGYGMTIVEAEKNASIALAYSEKYPANNMLHMVNDEQVVTTPFQNTEISAILQSDNMKIVETAKTIGISVTNLHKMIQFEQTRPINRFTSSDIADYFNIGKRAAERILKKFADSGYLKVIGEEQPHLNGRPRSIYRLTLPKF